MGSSGAVVGVELSDGLLAMARERADAEGLTNIELRAGNAEAIDVPASSFHAATARWGLMYINAPIAALTAARTALRPDGLLVAALWAEPERVDDFTLPRRLLERYRPVPPNDLEAPGTFRYAHLPRIERDFAEAGLAITYVEEMDVPVFEAETTDALVRWSRALGLTRLLNGLPEEIRAAWESDFARELERRRSGAVIQLGGVTRIVVARSDAAIG